MRKTKSTVAVASLVAVAVWAALAFGLPQIKIWRQSRQIHNEIGWIQDATRLLQKAREPTLELRQAASGGRWETEGYLIFSNGWVAVEGHSCHGNDGMDDITVLRVPDGPLYISNFHFCVGIMSETSLVDGERTQPMDPNDFLLNRAKRQGWNLFSRDGKLQCIVRSPRAYNRGSNKGLWVWIGSSDGTHTRTLFDRRYTISASRDMSWTVKWVSEDDMVLSVFDYWGRSPMLTSEELPTRQLRTLRFQRDKQSSKFLETTNTVTPNEAAAQTGVSRNNEGAATNDEVSWQVNPIAQAMLPPGGLSSCLSHSLRTFVKNGWAARDFRRGLRARSA